MDIPTADELDDQAGRLIEWVEQNVIKGKEYEDLDYDGLAQMAAMDLEIPVSADLIGQVLQAIAYHKNQNRDFS